MKKQIVITTLTAAGLMGQTAQLEKVQAEQALAFQQASTMGGGMVKLPMARATVTGSPVSAKEVNRTVQTLSDGTEIENTQTTMFYRDAQGRTRTEQTSGEGIVAIQDPVAGVRITLYPSNKTATRTSAGGGGWTMTARGGAIGTGEAGGGGVAVARGRGVTTATAGGGDAVALKESLDGALTKLRAEAAAARQQSNQEDLGFQMQNGILAQGTRTTVTIPKGQIGNSRDIKVVNERWYSKDLQMIVKSVNSDPRFGTTTYDLTNIVQGADPSLFQIPGNYTVTDRTVK